MFEEFDVIQLPSGDYELANGHSIVRLEFSGEEEKSIFESILLLRKKATKNIVKSLLSDYEKKTVYNFFLKFKTASLIFFDSEEALLEGHIFSINTSSKFKLEEAAHKPIAIISTSNFPDTLRQFDILANASVFEASSLLSFNEVKIDAIFKQSEIVIVDASSSNPVLLENINLAAVSSQTPWLLVQGIYEQVGHIGPLFYGNETGCYECFRNRLRSNMQNLECYDRYESWLKDENKFSQPGMEKSNSFAYHMAAIIATEIEKLFLEYDVPQSYGFLLEVNGLNYSVEKHRLYKVPFCTVCNAGFEYRRAPWLDAVTLGDVS